MSSQETLEDACGLSAAPTWDDVDKNQLTRHKTVAIKYFIFMKPDYNEMSVASRRIK
jgi:hypothetical protein